MLSKTFLTILFISLLALTFSHTSLAQTANVMVIHASPNAPGVDILVDNVVAKTNLTFPNNTPYLSVNGGTRNIKVNVTGTATSVINANLPFTAGMNYSVFAIDSVSKISALVVTDTLTAPASGKAHLRFFHLSPNAPAVDVALQGGAVLIANKKFKDYTSFIPLNAGTYNLEVRLAGTTTVVLSLPNVTLSNGSIYTVFAKGFVGGTGAQALGAQIIVNNAPVPTANLMVIHASPNAPGVDILVDNIVAKTNLTFPTNTPYLSVNEGTRNVKVNVTGTTTTVIEANLPLTGNMNYSVFAIDSVSKISALVVTDTLTTPAPGKAHLRFLHLSPNAPAVDVALQGGAVLIANKKFKDYTSYIPLNAGTYNLEVRLAGTTTVVLSLPNVTLSSGSIYTVFAKGFVGGTGAQALGAQIIVNNTTVPVELTSFSASVSGKSVNLNWSTATENNNMGFEIQRSSNKTSFVKIGFVNGNGTSTDLNRYSFTDNNVITTKNYYRLKQMDYDGSYKYSPVIEAEIGILSSFSLDQNYPNPFNPSTQIKYSLPSNSNVKITIYNALGESMKELANEVQQSGVHILNFNAAGLSSGVYFYSIQASAVDGNQSFRDTKKMILMK
jgi:hypothetical protein